MRAARFLALVVAGLMAGTTWASAQGFADNPPGWAFQKRGIIESEGYSPLNYGWRYRHWRGAYAWGHWRHYRFRHHHRHW
jgi:hypothetical protein